MIEFKKDLIMKKKVAIHCDTEEKAISLSKWAYRNGIHYKGVEWDECNNKLCYNLLGNSYCEISFYEKENYNILEYDDVVIQLKEKKKNDRIVYLNAHKYKLDPGIVISVGDNTYKIRTDGGGGWNIEKEYVWFDSPNIELKIIKEGFIITGEEKPERKYLCPRCGKKLSIYKGMHETSLSHGCLYSATVSITGSTLEKAYNNLYEFYESI